MRAYFMNLVVVGIVLIALGCSSPRTGGESVSTTGGAPTEEQLGLPFYPGSAAAEGSETVPSEGGTTYVSVRTTKDDPARIAEFYLGRLETIENDITMGEDRQILARNKNSQVLVLITGGKEATTITITVTIRR